MNKKKLYIGFDTSNYTTSVAVCDENGMILGNIKCPLPVKQGERGLRQSDAVFAHVKNFPQIARELRKLVYSFDKNETEFAAAACSLTPRDIEGSYMPCFLVGRAVAETVCAAFNIPLYYTSHQTGHVMAALSSACINEGLDINSFMNREHYALHFSGGTTEILSVSPDRQKVFEIKRIGGTSDASAGQIIDRIGVALGYSFPCGAEIDAEAMKFQGKIKSCSPSVKGLECNLSGLENKAEKMINDGVDTAEISAYILEYIAKTAARLVASAKERYGEKPVVFAGGVMSSAYIRCSLSHLGMFSSAEYSSDNAAGAALICKYMYEMASNAHGG
ncbi:MAG: peptidase M22 [Clostridiales bacterium]|nr:peptidase M22 [Clostridiales bacterium]